MRRTLYGGLPLLVGGAWLLGDRLLHGHPVEGWKPAVPAWIAASLLLGFLLSRRRRRPDVGSPLGLVAGSAILLGGLGAVVAAVAEIAFRRGPEDGFPAVALRILWDACGAGAFGAAVSLDLVRGR
ncbi:MAG: hypothetical protein ACREID_07130 [Planctomycetota bacterium]